MTRAALQAPPRRRDPDVVEITLRLTLRELILLYAVAYLAHAFAERASSAAAAGEGHAATVLHRATCRLYTGLYQATCRGGL